MAEMMSVEKTDLMTKRTIYPENTLGKYRLLTWSVPGRCQYALLSETVGPTIETIAIKNFPKTRLTGSWVELLCQLLPGKLVKNPTLQQPGVEIPSSPDPFSQSLCQRISSRRPLY